MSFKDLTIRKSYKSCGDNTIARDFLVPVLSQTKTYKRSVGFFSSGVLEPILNGVVELYRNGGKIQLIASPMLSKNDIEAINLGYQKREQVIGNSFDLSFESEIENCSDETLALLVKLIETETLDIKIAVTNTLGDYHDKLGILEDFDGNKIAFYGSANSSINGYQHNYEKVRVVCDWVVGDKESVDDEVDEFDSLWNGTNPYVNVYEYKESAKRKILEVIDTRSKNGKSGANSKQDIVLRDYQEEAKEAWVNNGFKGFLVMATGTGKTWTSIFSAKELLKEHSAMIVICAPYKHLVNQWRDDIVDAFPNANVILVSSENPIWSQQIRNEIIAKKYNPEKQIIIISTIASFQMKRFSDAIKASSEEKLLIVDEAHRFTYRPEELKETYKYMLGLSATPYSGTSIKEGIELMNFFGGQVYELTIEDAMKKGCLVNYNYYPIIINSKSDEEDTFQYYTSRIVSCFKNGICINKDLLIQSVRNRLRVISMAAEKQEKLKSIISDINENDHFIVYCGDGRLFDNNSGEEIKHIQSVKKALTEMEYKASQFTAKENAKERMQLVDSFNNGDISVLAAIRCLDEGINIPSIKSALILSSNDNYREFVQRRGRILRKYDGKEYANIYDVIVLPSSSLQAWAKIELRRFYEYAKLAINWEETLEPMLMKLLNEYGLSFDDVNVYDYENMEEELDE